MKTTVALLVVAALLCSDGLAQRRTRVLLPVGAGVLGVLEFGRGVVVSSVM